MARKEATFTATDGRDAGKQFLLREMPASQAEMWAIRVMLAMGRSGIEIPEAFKSQGFAGLLAILDGGADDIGAAVLSALKLTFFANIMRIDPDDAMPLLAEMMACCQRVETNVTRALVDDDIEEIATRMKIRAAIWNLHTDFFVPAGHQTSASGRPARSDGSSTIKPRPR